jgi:hypothetical protein
LRITLKLSIIVPFYNEQDSIGPLHASIIGAVAPLPIPFETVCVDDGTPYYNCGTALLSCGLQRLRLSPLWAPQQISLQPCHGMPALKSIRTEWGAPDRDVAVVTQRRSSGTR